MILYSITYYLTWLGLLFMLILFQCKTTRSTSNDQSSHTSESKQELEIYSANTKMFLQDLEKEATVSVSERFREKYGLIKIKGTYYVGATAKTDEDLDRKKLKELGVKIGARSDDIITLKIPILQVEEVKNIRGITYLDIDRKVPVR